MCSVCQRVECANLTFTIRLEDGKKVENCCARCGLHYLAQERPAVASLRVRDFDSAKSLDARGAFYVEGSDVTPCSTMMDGPAPRDERGCCMKAVYDRCLPSLLAFETRSRADVFAREHGGEVRAFEQIRASVH